METETLGTSQECQMDHLKKRKPLGKIKPKEKIDMELEEKAELLKKISDIANILVDLDQNEPGEFYISSNPEEDSEDVDYDFFLNGKTSRDFHAYMSKYLTKLLKKLEGEYDALYRQ